MKEKVLWNRCLERAGLVQRPIGTLARLALISPKNKLCLEIRIFNRAPKNGPTSSLYYLFSSFQSCITIFTTNRFMRKISGAGIRTHNIQMSLLPQQLDQGSRPKFFNTLKAVWLQVLTLPSCTYWIRLIPEL